MTCSVKQDFSLPIIRLLRMTLFTWFDVYEINNYTPFFLLFFAGSFLKKYQPEIIKNNSCLILCLGIAYFLIFIGLRYYAMSVYKTLDNVPFVIYTFLMSSHAQDFVLTTCSFLIFSGCVYLSVKSNFFINLIASTTFGIYLLHNHNYFRRNIWFDFFKLNNHFSDNNLILYMIFCVSAVFAVCHISPASAAMPLWLWSVHNAHVLVSGLSTCHAVVVLPYPTPSKMLMCRERRWMKPAVSVKLECRLLPV